MSNPGAAIFTPKKAPAARRIAATGLVKSRAAIFTEKKAPAARRIAATGLVKSRAAIFPEKKSACGKLVSSNRACQVRGGQLSEANITMFKSQKVGLALD